MATTKVKPAKKPTPKPKTSPSPAPKKTIKAEQPKTTKKGKGGNIIVWIITIVAAIAVITAVCIYVCNRNQPTISIEDGQTVKAKYVSPKDADYRLLIPTEFEALSDDAIKEEFGDDTTPEFVYQSKDKNANLTIARSEEKIANDQIEGYLNALKLAFSATAKNVTTDYYTVSDHNIGVVSFEATSDGEDTYSKVAVFSENGKLTLINFNCTKATKDQWQKTGEAIIKSLEFTK